MKASARLLPASLSPADERSALRRGHARLAAQVFGGLGGLVGVVLLAALPWLWLLSSTAVVTTFVWSATMVGAGLVVFAAAAALLRADSRDMRGSVPEQLAEWHGARPGVMEERSPEWARGWSVGPLARAQEVTVGPALVSRGEFADLVGQLSMRLGTGTDNAGDRFESPVVMGEIPADGDTICLVGPLAPEWWMDLVGGTDLDPARVGLERSWRVRGNTVAGARSLLTDQALRAIHSFADPTVIVTIDNGRFAVWSGEPPSVVALNDWMAHAQSLGRALSVGHTRYLQVTAARVGEEGPGASAGHRPTALGNLFIASVVRRRWGYVRSIAGFLAAESALAAVLAPFVPVAHSSWIRFGVLAAMTVTSGAIGLLAARRVTTLRQRHERVVAALAKVASRRGMATLARLRPSESTWKRDLFVGVRGLRIGPSAQGGIAGARTGVAYLQGDSGLPFFAVSSFASWVVWAELPRALEPVDFVPEGISDAVVRLVGGRDVDVESYDFNRRWRVKAADEREAHGVLQPRMIDFLNSVEDPAVAFHVDCERVLIWDDGKDEDVDLDARVRLLEEFLDRLPGHLR